jgi:2,4-dienoyl-CoA reductase-like NADH-dependent reductase (Old Yellow Enzyme family)
MTLNKPVDAVEGLSFFAPKHARSPGTPVDPNAKVPTLFTPLTIRGATLKNRIIVAPMCQYSSAAFGPAIGALTPYHVATLGHYALKGAALVFIEASGVQPNGRISPHCPGIWSDDQIPGVASIAEICHAQGALVALQLAHGKHRTEGLFSERCD